MKSIISAPSLLCNSPYVARKKAGLLVWKQVEISSANNNLKKLTEKNYNLSLDWNGKSISGKYITMEGVYYFQEKKNLRNPCQSYSQIVDL